MMITVKLSYQACLASCGSLIGVWVLVDDRRVAFVWAPAYLHMNCQN